jgi:vancomycin permeability regulator SanA
VLAFRGAAARVAARAIGLFFGLFSLANAVAAIRSGHTEDLWWVDIGGLPTWVTSALWLAAVLLVAYGIAPDMRPWRRRLTALVGGVLSLVASGNAWSFYSAWRSGTIVPLVPVPFSALVALGFGLLTLVICRDRPGAPMRTRGELVLVTALALLLAAAFPIVHVYTFGTTDYRRPADVAVVFGARVYADGSLTTSAEDRVRTAAGLYTSGLVPHLIMSGGVGESGFDETVAMRDRATALGVPAEAITLDGDGVSTDRTVASTAAMFEADGTDTVLAVSQFYHLPRVKMAYRSAGWNVYTVPAEKSRPILKTPQLVLREIPGFWAYWGRAWFRDVTGPRGN